MSEQTPAGWYDDPEAPGSWRWWDGQAWAAPQAAAIEEATAATPDPGAMVSDGAPPVPTEALPVAMVGDGTSGSALAWWQRPKPLAAAAIGGALVALVVGIGIGGASSSSTSTDAAPVSAGEPAPTVTVTVPVPAPAETVTVAPPEPVDSPPTVVSAPSARDYTVTPKILSKQCFGSAGCSVDVRLEVAGNRATDNVAAELTVTVTGDEDGPAIETISLAEDGSYDAPELSLDTRNNSTRITAKVTQVTVR